MNKVTFTALRGVITATIGKAPEQDWGHGPYRSAPGVPAYLARFILASENKKGITRMVINPVALRKEVGGACLARLLGDEGYFGISTLSDRAETFAWPMDWPRDEFEYVA